MTQKLPNVVELAKQAYQDAGVKNPERFLNLDQGLPQEAMMIAQEAEQMIQQAQQRIGELEKELAITKAVNEAKVMEAQMRAETQINITEFKTQLEGELSVLKAQLEVAKSAGSQQGPGSSLSEVDALAVWFARLTSV